MDVLKSAAYPYNTINGKDFLIGNFEWHFGFNGHEKDNEVAGTGNSVDFGARVHDTRLGRFLSIDPDVFKYPFMSPYCYAANSPINMIDKVGKGPEKPFSAYVYGDFYAVGFQSASDRKYDYVSKKIVFSSGGLLGAGLDIGLTYYDLLTNEDKVSAYDRVSWFRDVTKESNQLIFNKVELPNTSKAIGSMGHVFTATDIIYQLESNETREERLVQLVVYASQLELQGRVDPGSTKNSYLNIPKESFKDAQQASDVLNNMYSILDQTFKGLDLTNDIDFNIAKNQILSNKGPTLSSIAQDALKEDAPAEPANYCSSEDCCD